MNSYIDIEREKEARRERAERTVYGVTEAGALLVCAIVNFFYRVLAFVKSDVVSIIARGVTACACAVLVIGTVGACDRGSLALFDCVTRIIIICAVSFVVYKIFDNE